MQEITDVAPPQATRRLTTKEERVTHVNNWKKSNLSMTEYCRNNNIALASLSDWKRSIIRDSKRFKPVKLQSTIGMVEKPPNILEIMVHHHIKIRLQHISDVSMDFCYYKSALKKENFLMYQVIQILLR